MRGGLPKSRIPDRDFAGRRGDKPDWNFCDLRSLCAYKLAGKLCGGGHDEHPRVDGINRHQCRPRLGCGARLRLLYAGYHGAGHYLGDNANVKKIAAASLKISQPVS